VGIEISNCRACQETEYINIVILGGKLYIKKKGYHYKTYSEGILGA
jgi:hypothetical protein